MQNLKLQFRIQNYLMLSILAFVAMPIFASEIYINPRSQEIKTDEQFEISVFLDTEGENINTIDGRIIFPKDLLILEEIKDGNSIINFWIKKPKTESDNQIIFSGIVPGGYVGKQGLVFSAIFQSKNEGIGIIEAYQTRVFLNDGKGTEANLTTSNFQFIVSKEFSSTQILPTQITDTNSPELFSPIISQDSIIFDGKYFLVFATQDKGVGISHYEILEKGQQGSLRQFLNQEEWQIKESPYLLRDQKLKSYIYIKAVDKVGNERIITIFPQNPLKWYENYFVLFTIFMGITLIAWKYIKKLHSAPSLFNIILIVISLASPISVLAADLYFSPTTNSYNVGQVFSVDLYISSMENAINAASGMISFPPDKLEIISLSKDNSVFNLWVSEPTFSNNTGLITFEGIVLNPGFIGPAGKIININFKAKEAGNAPLIFYSSSALANDGQGTNVLANIGSGNYTIQSKLVPLIENVSLKAFIPLCPSSPTHPNSEKWYSDNNPKFIWEIPENVTGIRLLADHQPTTPPIVFYSELISEKLLENLTDGVWYFHVQFQNNFGWEEASHFKFQIDTTNPLFFEIKAKEGKKTTNSQPTLIFEAVDEMSEIDYYEIRIDQKPLIKIEEAEYKMPIQSLGIHTIIVKAIDIAGNSTLAITEIDILPIEETISGCSQIVPLNTSLLLGKVVTSPIIIRMNGLTIDLFTIITVFLVLILIMIFGMLRVWTQMKPLTGKIKLVRAEKSMNQIFKTLKEEVKRIAKLNYTHNASEKENTIYDKLKKVLKKIIKRLKDKK